jgi:hypothetical protein
MTTRILFDRKKRFIMAMAICALSFAAVGAELANSGFLQITPYHASLPGGILFILIMVYANLFAFRCSRCRTNWGSTALNGTRFFAIDSRIKYCPVCGIEIDATQQ